MKPIRNVAAAILMGLLTAGCVERQPDYTPVGDGMKAIGICMVVYAVVNGLFSLVLNEENSKSPEQRSPKPSQKRRKTGSDNRDTEGRENS